MVRRDWNFTVTKSRTSKLFHPYSRCEPLGRSIGTIADIVSCHGTIQSGCCYGCPTPWDAAWERAALHPGNPGNQGTDRKITIRRSVHAEPKSKSDCLMSGRCIAGRPPF